MNNPLLIFYTIFDNKLKLMIVLNLLRNERMSFNELLWETDSLEELLERALYELQRLNIISESYERIEIQYELTMLLQVILINISHPLFRHHLVRLTPETQ